MAFRHAWTRRGRLVKRIDTVSMLNWRDRPRLANRWRNTTTSRDTRTVNRPRRHWRWWWRLRNMSGRERRSRSGRWKLREHGSRWIEPGLRLTRRLVGSSMACYRLSRWWVILIRNRGRRRGGLWSWGKCWSFVRRWRVRWAHSMTSNCCVLLHGRSLRAFAVLWPWSRIVATRRRPAWRLSLLDILLDILLPARCVRAKVVTYAAGDRWAERRRGESVALGQPVLRLILMLCPRLKRSDQPSS